MVQDGSFAWETPESRKVCEEFGDMLNARFATGKPGQQKGEKKAEEKKVQGSEESKNYVTLKHINFSVLLQI